MMNRPHLSVDGLQAAKRSLDVAELFVTAHYLRRRHGFHLNIGADDVDTIEFLFAIDAVRLALIAERILFDADAVVLAHFEAPEYASDAQANEVLAAQGTF